MVLDFYLDSYSQELTCGRSTPLENGDFIFLLIDSYSESSHVADQVADLPPLDMAILESYSESSHVAHQVADVALT